MIRLRDDMTIQQVKLYNVRSYGLFETKLGSKGTVIVGPNGTGKTNLLEAIYILLRGGSFRGSLGDCMAFGAEQTILHAELEDGSRRIILRRSDDTVNKEFIINDHHTKLLSRKHHLPVVLFEPNELRLISSSPARRRDFLDGLISRLDAHYGQILRAFTRTLLQRNELLKQHNEMSAHWRDHLFAWDVKFVQLAAAVATQRARFLYKHETEIAQTYALLAGRPTPLTVEYIPSASLDNYEQALLDRLERTRDYEIITGHTSVGPQREDFLISLHNQPAAKVASRGEMRTIMLAFKLLELNLQTKRSETRPLILLDDVFSELDTQREQLLQEAIHHYQFIVTTTDRRHTTRDCLVITTNQA